MFAHFFLGLSQIFAISKVNFKKWGIVFIHVKDTHHKLFSCHRKRWHPGSSRRPFKLQLDAQRISHIQLSLGRRKGVAGWNRSCFLLKEHFHNDRQLLDIFFVKFKKNFFFKVLISKVMLWNLRRDKGNPSQPQFCKWLPDYSLWKGTNVLLSRNWLWGCWF